MKTKTITLIQYQYNENKNTLDTKHIKINLEKRPRCFLNDIRRCIATTRNEIKKYIKSQPYSREKKIIDFLSVKISHNDYDDLCVNVPVENDYNNHVTFNLSVSKYDVKYLEDNAVYKSNQNKIELKTSYKCSILEESYWCKVKSQVSDMRIFTNNNRKFMIESQIPFTEREQTFDILALTKYTAKTNKNMVTIEGLLPDNFKCYYYFEQDRYGKIYTKNINDVEQVIYETNNIIYNGQYIKIDESDNRYNLVKEYLDQDLISLGVTKMIVDKNNSIFILCDTPQQLNDSFWLISKPQTSQLKDDIQRDTIIINQ